MLNHEGNVTQARMIGFIAYGTDAGRGESGDVHLRAHHCMDLQID